MVLTYDLTIKLGKSMICAQEIQNDAYGSVGGNCENAASKKTCRTGLYVCFQQKYKLLLLHLLTDL